MVTPVRALHKHMAAWAALRVGAGPRRKVVVEEEKVQDALLIVHELVLNVALVDAGRELLNLAVRQGGRATRVHAHDGLGALLHLDLNVSLPAGRAEAVRAIPINSALGNEGLCLKAHGTLGLDRVAAHQTALPAQAAWPARRELGMGVRDVGLRSPDACVARDAFDALVARRHAFRVDEQQQAQQARRRPSEGRRDGGLVHGTNSQLPRFYGAFHIIISKSHASNGSLSS
mmetsp:Transcript_11066/g.29942  ORF Transcript_11066/g.29942 Transcript_11066/m.29942 type:complete len:231 (-) Transcript_11066:59-751(-)